VSDGGENGLKNVDGEVERVSAPAARVPRFGKSVTRPR
jgi:hypothetical protein